MKKITSIILIILFCIALMAEPNRKEIENQIDTLVDALNSNDYDIIKSEISHLMMINGQEYKFYEATLEQAFKGYPFEIDSYKIDLMQNENSNYYTESTIFLTNGDTKKYKILFDRNYRFISLGFVYFDPNKSPVQARSSIADKYFWQEGLIIVDGKMMVNGYLEGKEYKFLFDTGAKNLVLNKDVLENPSNSDSFTISEFRFGNHTFKDKKAVLKDLSSFSNSLGIKIAGLISYNEVKNDELIFDIANNILIGLNLDSNGNRLKNVQVGAKNNIVKFEMINHIPTFGSQIGLEKLKVGFDSGAEVNILDVKKKDKFANYVSNITNEKVMSVDKTIDVETGYVSKTKIGLYWVSDMKASFVDFDDFTNNSLQGIDGLIGFELLSKRKISINYIKKEMAFLK